jgi:Na+/melibiose symporter-like transporter
VVDRLFFAHLGIPAVILAVAMYFIWKYPLNRKRMAGIRAELEARRSRLSS